MQKIRASLVHESKEQMVVQEEKKCNRLGKREQIGVFEQSRGPFLFLRW